MRKKVIAANWKMNKTLAEAEDFASSLKASLDEVSHCDIIVFPPFTSLHAVARRLEGTAASTGAQDMFWEERGAFTGEISGEMIKDAGASYVLVGHSERRSIIGEGHEVVAKKLKAAFRSNLLPILCVGEKLYEREAGKAEDVVREQVESALYEVTKEQVQDLVIAYEPVWAIGTGKTASPDDAVEMHGFIRKLIADRYGRDIADSTRIQYGGSVKPENAKSLLREEEIDGALIGGASLDVNKFIAIAKAVS